MVWDWTTRTMLTLWFWVILTHFHIKWIQDSEFPTAPSQPLSLSCMGGLLHPHSTITLHHGDAFGLQNSKWWVSFTLCKFSSSLSCWHPGQGLHLSMGSVPHVIQSSGVASSIFSKGFLDCCSVPSVSSLPPIDAMTMLSWVKSSQMKVKDSLHEWDHSSYSFYIPVPSLSRWWWVETRGAINTEKAHILGMLWLQPEEFKRRQSWKLCSVYLHQRFPDDKFNMTLK